MSLQLMFSRSNQAFVFAKGGKPSNLSGERMFFRNKADALKAAGRHGLQVDAQGNTSALGGLEGARKYNQKAYTHYVVVWPSDMSEPRGTVSGSERPGARIDSGWEFREDAKDRFNEVSESEDMKAKIVAKVSLKSWGLDPDSNDDWITSEGFSGLEGISSRTRVGTRVRFQPTPASLPLYSNPPTTGEEGSVTTVSFGGGVKKSFLPGPGGGLLYVKWDRTGVQGVSPIDLVKASGRSGMRAGPGKPGMKFERDDVEITTTLHPLQLDGADDEDEGGFIQSLSFGQFPKFEEFESNTQKHFPYLMELVGSDEKAVTATGVVGSDGIYAFNPRYESQGRGAPRPRREKYSVNIESAEAMYRFLQALLELPDDLLEPGESLASAIMGTLGYEWV